MTTAVQWISDGPNTHTGWPAQRCTACGMFIRTGGGPDVTGGDHSFVYSDIGNSFICIKCGETFDPETACSKYSLEVFIEQFLFPGKALNRATGYNPDYRYGVSSISSPGNGHSGEDVPALEGTVISNPFKNIPPFSTGTVEWYDSGCNYDSTSKVHKQQVGQRRCVPNASDFEEKARFNSYGRFCVIKFSWQGETFEIRLGHMSRSIQTHEVTDYKKDANGNYILKNEKGEIVSSGGTKELDLKKTSLSSVTDFGAVGNTGWATGPHTHIEVYRGSSDSTNSIPPANLVKAFLVKVLKGRDTLPSRNEEAC